LHKARVSKFDRILDKAPAMFSTAQLRVFLRALVNIDPYSFDDVAEQLAANDENNQQTSEEILLSTIDGLPDDKLTGFALRLVITAHIPIPREGELDYLAEVETAFAPPQPKKAASKKTTTTPTPIKAAKKSAAKKTTAKKEVAA
jgi:ParB family chromosome partitioning protein